MHALTHLTPVRRLGLALGLSALFGSTAVAQIDPVYRLLRRITPGFNYTELQQARAMGFQAVLNEQLINYAGLDDAETTVLSEWPVVQMLPREVGANYNGLTDGAAGEDLQRARLWRWLASDQGFYERMVWFWENHFNIDYGKRAGPALLPSFLEEVNRKHTFGSFRDMIHAAMGTNNELVPVHGVMALAHYLDNDTSSCQVNPNENLAREALELYILGATHPLTGDDIQVYTETNVRDFARMISGWGLQVSMPADPTDFRFEFLPADHCDGPDGNPTLDYQFLGVTISPDDVFPTEGQLAIDAAVDYFDPPPPAGQDLGRVCATFIAAKLVRTFLTDAPLQGLNGTQILALRRALADAENAFGVDGDITAMLQAILTEDNVRDVLDAPNPMYKYMSPWHFMTAALRGSAAIISTSQGVDSLRSILANNLSQGPYAFGPPNGYSEQIDKWAQNQPGRWRFAYDLFELQPGGRYGAIPGVGVDVPRLYLQVGGFDRATCASQANELMAGGALSATEVQIIQDFANTSPDNDRDMAWKALFLTVAAPGFNLY